VRPAVHRASTVGRGERQTTARRDHALGHPEQPAAAQELCPIACHCGGAAPVGPAAPLVRRRSRRGTPHGGVTFCRAVRAWRCRTSARARPCGGRARRTPPAACRRPPAAAGGRCQRSGARAWSDQAASETRYRRERLSSTVARTGIRVHEVADRARRRSGGTAAVAAPISRYTCTVLGVRKPPRSGTMLDRPEGATISAAPKVEFLTFELACATLPVFRLSCGTSSRAGVQT
jgi:hypothetical protein